MKTKLLSIATCMIATFSPALAETIKLPKPDVLGGLPVNQALAERRSVRNFDSERELSHQMVSNLLWATCGVNRAEDGLRTNPTARNFQEIDAYWFNRTGVYRYDFTENALVEAAKGDHRSLVAGTESFRQDFVMNAPGAIVLVADATKAGSTAALIDAGIACENINIFCAGNGLATVPRMTMDADGIQKLLSLPETSRPVLNNPIGYSFSDDASHLIEAQGIDHDAFVTQTGKPVKIHFIKHASLILEINGKIVYVDPTKMFGNDFSKLPKADAVMVTHEHHDHYDPAAIKAVSKADTRFICNGRVAELAGFGEAMSPGDTIELFGVEVTATPAYNTTEEHLQFHPKARNDVGYFFNLDGLKIYVAGDTEDIPEMAYMGNVDIAFLPVNQPFTMTPRQAVNAINMIRPAIVYPYHYGDTNLSDIVDTFKDDSNIEVRVRDLQ